MLILMLLILLNLQAQHTIASEASMEVTRFHVPPLVQAGNSIRLSCMYELRDETLHAMKLFKDDKEFYRYTPATRREDQKMAFAVRGINVDLARSNENNVTLRKVDRYTSGLFKCQVSVENTFRSVSAERHLKVETDNQASRISQFGQNRAETSQQNNNNNRRQQQQQQQLQQQQQQQQQVIGISNKPSEQVNSSSNSNSAAQIKLFGFARFTLAALLLMAHIIFQSISALRWRPIQPD